MSRTKRAFIAFPIDDSSQAVFSAIIDELKVLGLPFNWIAAENLHMTAAFLGAVTDDEIKKIQQIVISYQQSLKPIVVDIAGLLGFPSTKRARVLALRFKGNNLKRLQRYVADIKRSLREEEVWFDEKEFKPHVTLGRSKSWHNTSFFNHVVPEEKVIFFPPKLYVSKLTLDGAEYMEVE